MKPLVIAGALVGLWVGGFGAAPLRAESVEIVTYYPAPATVTDDLHVRRTTIGNTYKALNFDDPLAPVADGTLLVEGNLGVGIVSGAPPVFAAAPNTQTTGNLNVNDVYLRSANSGAGAWASQSANGGPAGVMYLEGQVISPPPGCPAGWTEVATNIVPVDAAGANKFVRTCYRADNKPSGVMYLEGQVISPPPGCPAGWTEAATNVVPIGGGMNKFRKTCYRGP